MLSFSPFDISSIKTSPLHSEVCVAAFGCHAVLWFSQLTDVCGTRLLKLCLQRATCVEQCALNSRDVSGLLLLSFAGG